MTTRNRQPAGRPTGGQFAPDAKAGADISLDERHPTDVDPDRLTRKDRALWDVISTEEWGYDNAPKFGDPGFPSLYSSHDNTHLANVANTMAAHPDFEGLELSDLDDGGDTLVLSVTNRHNSGTHLTKSLNTRSMLDDDGDISGQKGALQFAKNLAREYEDLKEKSRPTTAEEIMNQANILAMMGREAKIKYTSDGGETIP